METKELKIAPTHGGIAKLKETVGDSKKRAKALSALIWFVEELDKLKHTEFAVRYAVIYGAFARGAKRFQQMEILLVLENNVAEDEAFDFIIDNAVADIYMEIPILFYLDVINPEMLKLAIEHPMPRFRQMQKGIVFYGQDVLHRETKEATDAQS